MTTLDPIVAGQAAGHRRSALTVAADDLADTANALLRGGFRVALVSGHDEGDSLRAVYLFTATGPDRRVELHVPLRRADPVVPSLAAMSFPAGRFEREMRDLYGIVPRHHPLPRRLVRHFHWPKGWYPMRADAAEAPRFGTADGPYPFRTVEGQGVYEIPVGPVHAGMIGPGHFRFSVVGETILNLKARLWFTHRGVEKLFEGRRAPEGVELAERVSGDTSVGHTLAYCQAVEDALGLDVDPAALRVRAILLELERLYNHVADLGALCNDVGHGILNTHALRIREELLRLGDLATGHRLLRGAVYPGGVSVAVLPDVARLAAVGEDIAELVELALGHSVVRDRFTGTATLTRQQAWDLGTLGYVARASGLGFDARHDHPQFQPPLPRSVHSRTDGDVLARFLVRAEEAAASVELIQALLADVAGYRGAPPDPARSLPAVAGSGVGIVEGWRGTIVHRIEFADDATLARVKIVDPSFFNWPALPVALADTIVPDFPLANKSFNLSYAGNDL
ncbi:Ni,Fe-hydrogenase III large subunit/Ni,Fe-hydrogenase III component G [Saccharomonospora amisosensis]|uniref:Ni,Fe-hydrogenase III large subunit/Ni,Fe-hydrogenase III component G n=1 Tax=Saccharomonospora amisosensis TaxID=1128677 RepID=A0A7X5UQ06_9PSEU|nr:NADH-quinone oxidoreductase subunit C [Saccharomonospora amisosensis]NIJ12031.1 Ni,Fe-hydrogenase III large subunit/Ni,Fe-hydrogenase III component G [Saccharomonospora amisosensis]